MGSLYEKIALHESCLFLDNIEQHATTAIQELSLIINSLRAKIHHLRDIVTTLAQGKVPVSLLSSEHARRVIKLALEETAKKGYVLSAHDNRIIFSSPSSLISLKNTLVYNIKVPIQRSNARRIQIYRLQKKSALSGRLQARIMYGFDTLFLMRNTIPFSTCIKTNYAIVPYSQTLIVICHTLKKRERQSICAITLKAFFWTP